MQATQIYIINIDRPLLCNRYYKTVKQAILLSNKIYEIWVSQLRLVTTETQNNKALLNSKQYPNHNKINMNWIRTNFCLQMQGDNIMEPEILFQK